MCFACGEARGNRQHPDIRRSSTGARSAGHPVTPPELGVRGPSRSAHVLAAGLARSRISISAPISCNVGSVRCGSGSSARWDGDVGSRHDQRRHQRESRSDEGSTGQHRWSAPEHARGPEPYGCDAVPHRCPPQARRQTPEHLFGVVAGSYRLDHPLLRPGILRPASQHRPLDLGPRPSEPGLS